MLRKMIIALAFMSPYGAVAAFESQDEQIDYILSQMKSGSADRKEEILERLQWSGLSEARLYDVFETELLEHYQEKYMEKEQASLLAYKVRALGYSGNLKYQKTLSLLASEAKQSNVKRHAKKAKQDLNDFNGMQKKLGQVEFQKDDIPFEVMTYMKMLKTDDSFTQRLAARAAFHERRNNEALLALVAEKLEGMYLNKNLDDLAQDSAAWMCKVLKQHSGYEALLKEVADKTPHRKISRYAS